MHYSKRIFFSWKKWLLLHTKIYNNLPQKLYCVLHSGLMKNKCQIMSISLKKNSRNVLIFAFKSKRHQCGIHPLILLNCFLFQILPHCVHFSWLGPISMSNKRFFLEEISWKLSPPSSYFVWQYHPFMMQPFFAIEHNIHTRYVCTYII